MSCKKYVEVTAKFDVDGTVVPLEIQWEDGAKFEIDRILGREKYLWLEETRWFIEAKESD